MRNIRRQSWLAATAILLAVSSRTQAQSPDVVFDDALSRGADAYVAGDRAAAVRLLADAMRRDPHDPRPYYLRALCLARGGHPDAARADLVVAAALESRNPHQYSVAGILHQLPVGDRTRVNQFRWHAQTEDFARTFDQGLITFDQRPEPAIHTDAGVLRQQVSLPLERLTNSVSLAELSDASAKHPDSVALETVAFETGSNPFADDAASPSVPADQTAATAEELPAAPAAAKSDAAAADPFGGTDSTASKTISSGKLLGILGRAVTRAAPLPSLDAVRNQLPNLPLPAAEDQPATAIAPAADADPFGAEVEPAAFTEEDPFGASPAATEAEPAMEAAPPATDEQLSPAEDEQPAADPEADPFG